METTLKEVMAWMFIIHAQKTHLYVKTAKDIL